MRASIACARRAATKWNIACIGGGPAGLYFSLLMKKAFPDVDITVAEKNKS